MTNPVTLNADRYSSTVTDACVWPRRVTAILRRLELVAAKVQHEDEFLAHLSLSFHLFASCTQRTRHCSLIRAFVYMSVPAKLKTYRSEIVSWRECVLRWTLETINFFCAIWPWPLTLQANAVFLNAEIACNLNTTGKSLLQFYVAVYLSWFYKSNKAGHIWPWPLTLRGNLKIDGCMQICAFQRHSLIFIAAHVRPLNQTRIFRCVCTDSGL